MTQLELGQTMMVEAAVFALATPFSTLDAVARAKREGTLAALLARPRTATAFVFEALARPAAAITGLVLLSLGLFSAFGRGAGIPVLGFLAAHLQLWLIALVFMLLGLFCSIALRDSVSAAGVCLLAATASLAAPLLAGPVIGRMANAESIIESSLLVSPVVSMATVTGVDAMRLEWVYRISPIGQRGFSYPAPSAGALYHLLLGTSLLLASIAWIRSRARSLQL